MGTLGICSIPSFTTTIQEIFRSNRSNALEMKLRHALRTCHTTTARGGRKKRQNGAILPIERPKKEKRNRSVGISVRIEKMTFSFQLFKLSFSLPPPAWLSKKSVRVCMFLRAPLPRRTCNSTKERKNTHIKKNAHGINLAFYSAQHTCPRISRKTKRCFGPLLP